MADRRIFITYQNESTHYAFMNIFSVYMNIDNYGIWMDINNHGNYVIKPGVIIEISDWNKDEELIFSYTYSYNSDTTIQCIFDSPDAEKYNMEKQNLSIDEAFEHIYNHITQGIVPHKNK